MTPEQGELHDDEGLPSAYERVLGGVFKALSSIRSTKEVGPGLVTMRDIPIVAAS